MGPTPPPTPEVNPDWFKAEGAVFLGHNDWIGPGHVTSGGPITVKIRALAGSAIWTRMSGDVAPGAAGLPQDYGGTARLETKRAKCSLGHV